MKIILDRERGKTVFGLRQSYYSIPLLSYITACDWLFSAVPCVSIGVKPGNSHTALDTILTRWAGGVV